LFEVYHPKFSDLVDAELVEASKKRGNLFPSTGSGNTLIFFVRNIPASASLKDYAPIPGNQGYLSSCTGWASAYAVRTIIESCYLNRTDKFLSTKMAFSPLFLYFAAREFKNVPSDEEVADPVDILNFMTLYGMPRRAVFDDNPIAYEQLQQQGFLINPVPGFSKLFNTNVTPAYKIEQVKKSLADDNPVIIGICVPDSFSDAKDIWTPENGESRKPENGHALCVVGYDDKKYGGAFEIMNSWGEEWGNNGFTQENNHPVVHISFYDAAEYCNWLSKKEGLTPVYTVSANNVND